MSNLPISISSTTLASLDPTTSSLAAAFLLGYEGATRQAYGRDLAAWCRWCSERPVEPLNATRGHVDPHPG